MARIVLATIGSLGDIHPFIAIGRALVAQGEQVVLAVPEDGVAKVRAAGLEAAPILPSYAAICDRLGMSAAEAATRLIADPDFVVDEILMPSLDASTRALDELAAGADVLAGSIFTFAAAIVAEKRRLPLAAVILQPMTLLSAWQPPTAPRFELMRHHPRTAIGRGWNRAAYALGRTMLRRRYAGPIDAVRGRLGLGPSIGAPLLDHGVATAATICCWSRALGALPPDAPANAVMSGFPLFDSESGADEAIAPELGAFLDDGDPPLIFTLGSVAVAAAGRFYEEAAAASRAIGKRAIMLTGQAGPPQRDGDCLVMGYAPHSAIFPGAAAVVHHGGIGTTGQALRAGCVQIVVPHYGDQFDNAARLRDAGVGAILDRKTFDRVRVARLLSSVLASPDTADAARRAATIVAAEDGATVAARQIAGLCR
jgi:rhamnosyltransferase subunit B